MALNLWAKKNFKEEEGKRRRRRKRKKTDLSWTGDGRQDPQEDFEQSPSTHLSLARMKRQMGLFTQCAKDLLA